MFKRENLTIPNALSVSRVIFLPILFVLLHKDLRVAFAIVYLILALTDLFDGWIARRFNQHTEIGVFLDSYADIIFYLSTAYFLYVLAPDYLTPNLPYLYVMLGVLGFQIIYTLIRFKKVLLLHTQLAKLGAASIVVLPISAALDIVDTTIVIAVVITILLLGFLEELLIFFIHGEVEGDTRSVFSAKPKNKNAD